MYTSFSGRVKEELVRAPSLGRSCDMSELRGILLMSGRITEEEGSVTLEFRSENELVARKYFTLLKNRFNINECVVTKHISERKGGSTVLVVKGKPFLEVAEANLQLTACKRAFLRGVFLAAGSISDPKKSYHLEIVCESIEQARELRTVIRSMELDAKIVARKGSSVLYIKEGSQIVDMLNIMEAHISLMEFENVRIEKDMRNSVNRKVNCEMANLNKMVAASYRQKEDIRLIKDTIGFDHLPENLQEIAEVRLQFPNEPLKELGAMLDPPLGKSGVNHRLRKISEIAERLRQGKEI